MQKAKQAIERFRILMQSVFKINELAMVKQVSAVCEECDFTL